MPKDAQRRASDLFVDCLKKEGVQRIFGIPGEESLALLDSIRRSGIDFIVTRHEQAAAFMAATCGRLTGKAGELEALIARCVDAKGVHVIDCPVDYSENVRVFTEELPKLTAAI